MIIIIKYQNKLDLINQILSNYIQELNKISEINQRILEDKDWASSKSDYHKECREKLNIEIKMYQRQISLLKK